MFWIKIYFFIKKKKKKRMRDRERRRSICRAISRAISSIAKQREVQDILLYWYLTISIYLPIFLHVFIYIKQGIISVQQ